MAHQLVDEVEAARGTCPQHLAGEHDAHGIDRPRLADRAAGAAEAGKNAQVHLGKADAGLVVIDGNPIVAGQGQLETTAEAEAVNARHERYGQRFDAGKQCMGAPEGFRQHRKIAHRVELGNIRPGDKAAILAR